MYTIRKKFRFEMAHVLSSSYSEECQKVHGHSYILEIIIQSMSLNKDGMVIDFKLLKEVIQERIIGTFDHNFIIQKPKVSIPRECLTVLPFLKNIVLVDYNPTAENMVKDIYNRLYSGLSHIIPSFRGLRVRLHETSTGWAEYGLEVQNGSLHTA